MRFNSQIGMLPRPVLRPDDHDSSYVGCDFEFELEIDEDMSPHKLKIKHRISQPDIINLIKQEKAIVALAVHCDSTYFYEVYDLANKPEQTISLEEKNVFGNVYFTLIVRAVKPIAGFSPKKLDSIFSGLSFDISRGDILGVSTEYLQFYGLPPLEVGDSIFDLVLRSELGAEDFEVSLKDQKIEIGVGARLNELIQQNMNTTPGREKNISAVYFPALIDVLYQIREESYEGKAWYEAISSALRSIGIDLSSDNLDPLPAAQQLLKAPYIRLFERV